MENIKILSLGWGVQSWTIAAMVALGDLPPIDFAIHSDTTWEMERTYLFAKEWTPWLENRGVKVVTVTSGVTRGMVSDERAGTFIPAFTLDNEGSRGQLRRQCTGRWKIQPMRRYISQALKEKGLKKTPGIVDQLLGITIDEFHRAKDSDVKYIKHSFPLIDKKMNRFSCIAWLNKHNLPNPGKSSCTFCPYHNRLFWEKMKRKGGKDWEQSVWVDERIRNERPPYPLFVNPLRLPLEEAVSIPEDYGAKQPDIFDAECDSGYCFL